MDYERLYKMPFSDLFLMYVQKAVKKNRTQSEVETIIEWLLGYSKIALHEQIQNKVDLRTFFEKAPNLNPKSSLITGLVCGVRVEEVSDPLMKKIRYLDKLVDELAKGRSMEKILRK